MKRMKKRSPIKPKQWYFMRIEENSNSTLQEIKWEWTWEEVTSYHVMLDEKAELEQAIRKEHEKSTKK